MTKMKGVTLALLFICSCLCVQSSVILGADECTQSGSTICHSLAQAENCGLVSACAKHIWSQKPQMMSEVSTACEKCKDIVAEVKIMLSMNETVNEITSVLEAACARCPYPDECREVIVDHVNSILNMIENDVQPDTLCTMLGVCKEMILTDSTVCKDSEYKCERGETCCLSEDGEYGCCPYADATCCKDGVHCCPTDYTCDIDQGTCNHEDSYGNIRSFPFVKKTKAPATCSECVIAVDLLKEKIKSGDFDAYVNGFEEEICSRAGSYQENCVELINTAYLSLTSYLSDTTSREICEEIDLCDPERFNAFMNACDILLNNQNSNEVVSENNLDAYVDRFSPLLGRKFAALPSLLENSPQGFKSGHHNRGMHTRHHAPHQQRSLRIRRSLAEEGVTTNLVATLRESVIMIFTSLSDSINAGDACEACKSFATKMGGEIKRKSSKAEINSKIGYWCNTTDDKVVEMCNTFLHEDFIDYLFYSITSGISENDLAIMENPSVVCSQLPVCSEDEYLQSAVIKPFNDLFGSIMNIATVFLSSEEASFNNDDPLLKCDMCQLVIPLIKSSLEAGKTAEFVRQMTINSLCGSLENYEYEEKCSVWVTNNFNTMMDASQEDNSFEICTKLRVC